MNMMLRDYQREMLDSLHEAWRMSRSVMVQMPTGTGKTLVLASIVREELCRTKDVSILIVAHRRELIDQIKKTVRRLDIPCDRVAVESVQMISRGISEGRKMQRNGLCRMEPSLVIVDEAHHALAKTYRLLWQRWPKARFLGLTATPCRMNGDGFTDLFDTFLESWSVKRFIAEGWLSPFDYFSIKPDSDDQRLIDTLDKRGTDGDYQTDEMRGKLDVRPTIERLYDTFHRYVADRKGIVYAIDIQHAEHIAAYYQTMGVNAVVVSSKTPKRQRKELISRFRSGGDYRTHQSTGSSDLQVLVSVDLFSEGFDCPDVEFIQLARPTLSLSKYLQMVGRGLRPCEGKQCCVILDNVGMYRMFGLPTAERDWMGWFTGSYKKSRAVAENALSASRNECLGEFPSYLMEQEDSDVVKITSHEQQKSAYGQWIECRQAQRENGDGSWSDMSNNIIFDKRPFVIDYGGLELSSDDGMTLYPRLQSRLIDRKHGINRKALEVQVGCGVSWQRRFINLEQPNRIYQLMEIKKNHVRIYQDEQGGIYVQKDLDSPLLSVEEAGGMESFMTQCDNDVMTWHAMLNDADRRKCALTKGNRYGVVTPGGAMLNEEENDLLHVVCGDGEEYWIDLLTKCRHDRKPVAFRRGFLSLLKENDMIFVRNISGQEGKPYKNWAVKADQHICTIYNTFYLKDDQYKNPYHIKKRSDDFRMFVVIPKWSEYLPEDLSEELVIMNQPGEQPLIRRMSPKM